MFAHFGGLTRQAGIADPDVRRSLGGKDALPATTAYEPDTRGRYTLTHLHARGGIGQVWLARDENLGRDVALKELRPEQAGSPSVRDRFLREARVTGQLEHPCIVPVYELAGEPDGRTPFYAMRFVRGRTLADAVAEHHKKRQEGRGGPLGLRELLNAFIATCNAVAYAHSRGVIHRDLKPQNVLLGEFGEVVVGDWGLAKVLREGAANDNTPVLAGEQEAGGQTLQGQVLGTPAYMAPEQAEGRLDRVGTHTDVYGLGAILYEILTGKPPFDGQGVREVLRKVVQDPPPRAREQVASAPAALEAIILKALAKRPEDRYTSAAEVTQEVQQWLADEPVQAYREPWLVRAGRWWRRHATAVGVAQVLGFLAAVALVASFQLPARRQFAARETERRHARDEARKAEGFLKRAEGDYRLARDALGECVRLRQDPRLRRGPLAEVGQRLLAVEENFLKAVQSRPRPGREGDTELAGTHWRLGEINQERDQLRLALLHYHWSLDIQEQLAAGEADGPAGPRPILLNGEEGRRVAELGSRTLKQELWAGKKDAPGGTLYCLACLYAQASVAAGEKRAGWAAVAEAERGKRAEQYAARAVRLLDRARAGGYFTKATLDEMKGERLLAPLRSREDFQRQSAQLEKSLEAGQPGERK